MRVFLQMSRNVLHIFLHKSRDNFPASTTFFFSFFEKLKTKLAEAEKEVEECKKTVKRCGFLVDTAAFGSNEREEYKEREKSPSNCAKLPLNNKSYTS
jgi:hypothetical protein